MIVILVNRSAASCMTSCALVSQLNSDDIASEPVVAQTLIRRRIVRSKGFWTLRALERYLSYIWTRSLSISFCKSWTIPIDTG